MKTHVVVAGDTLSKLAARYYGNANRWKEIWEANKSRSDFQNPDLLAIGIELLIPGPNKTVGVSGKKPEQMTVTVDGYEIPFESAAIIRGVDMAVASCTLKAPWNPGQDRVFDRVTKAYGYLDAAAYIGNTLLVSGRLYKVEQHNTKTGGRYKILGIDAYSADAVDSTLQPGYEWNAITLEDLAREVLRPFGNEAVFEVDTGGQFDRITAGETDKAFDFLVKYASQRGILIGCTPEGRLRFHKVNPKAAAVGTLREGAPGITAFKIIFDGRKRFHDYQCIRNDAGASFFLDDDLTAEPSAETAVDRIVPLTRALTFKLDDVTGGNILNAAEWKRNRQFLEAFSLPVPVAGWYAPSGVLWREGQGVTIISETLDVSDGFTFIIRSIEYKQEKDKRTATLNVAPPEVLAGGSLGGQWAE